QSKKALLKYKPKGTKLVFDDEGEAHQIVELVDEEKFKKEGNVHEMRRRFIEEQAEKSKVADIEDRALAKQKRKEKREKRKRREREEMGEYAGETVAQLVPYEEDEEGEMGADESEEEERPQKRAKKWFEEEGPA